MERESKEGMIGPGWGQVSDDSAMVADEAGRRCDDGNPPLLVAVKDDALPPGKFAGRFRRGHWRRAGRRGTFTPDELIGGIAATSELTPEVLAGLLSRINAEGVALVEDDVEALAAEIEGRVQSRAGARTNAASNAGARRKANGTRPTSAETSGSAEDPVHTYLKEIGRVPLLKRSSRGRDRAGRSKWANEATARIALHEAARRWERPGRRSLEGQPT